MKIMYDFALILHKSSTTFEAGSSQLLFTTYYKESSSKKHLARRESTSFELAEPKTRRDHTNLLDTFGKHIILDPYFFFYMNRPSVHTIPVNPHAATLIKTTPKEYMDTWIRGYADTQSLRIRVSTCHSVSTYQR